MNKTFKVVSNALRGTVVCSEKSSSYQGRAVKTVIASAVAALAMGAGAAMAADGESAAPETPEYVWQNKTITEDVTPTGHIVIDSVTQKSGTLTIGAGVNVNRSDNGKNYSGKYTLERGEISVADHGNFEVRDFTMKAGSISATGKELNDDLHGRTQPAFGAYNSFVMESGTADLTQGGRLWIGTANKNDPAAYNRMELKGGTVNLTEGGYITGNKRVIKAGEYYPDADKKPTVTVKEDTLGYNTIGFDGAQVNVKGKKNVIDAVATELTAGELNIAKDADLTVRAHTATNETEPNAGQLIDENSRFTVTGGKLKNEGTLVSEVSSFEVKGGTVENTGLLDVTNLTVSDAGTVSTVYTKKNFAFDTVKLLTGGTLKLDALNSRADGQKITDELPGDRLLLNEGSWTFAGGKLAVGSDDQYKGEVKVGRADSKADLTIAGGSYDFSKISFGSSNKVLNKEASTLTVTADSNNNYGQLKVGTLDFSNGTVNVADGVLTVDKLVHDGKGQGSMTVEDELVTTGNQLFTKGEGEDAKWGLTTAADKISFQNGGVLTITDSFEAKADEIKAANTLLGTDIIFENVKLTDEKVAFDQALGYGGINNEVAAGDPDADGKVALTIDADKSVGVGTLSVTDKTTDVVVQPSSGKTGVGELIIAGTEKGGNVISGVKSLKTLTTGDLSLGKDAKSNGTLNAETVNVTGDLDVDGSWTASKVVLSTAGNEIREAASLTVTTLGAAEASAQAPALTNNGTLAVNRIEADVNLAEGSTLVLGDRIQVAKTADADTPAAAADFAAEVPSVDAEAQPETVLGQQIASVVQTGDQVNVVVGTSADSRAKLLARAGDKFDAKKNVGLYADSTIGVDSTKGQLIVGTPAQGYTPAAGSVTLGSNSVTVIDLPSFADGSAVFAAKDVNVQSDAQILLNGADRISTTLLVEGGKLTGTTASQLALDNGFLTASLADAKKGTAVIGQNLVIGFNDNVTKDPVGKVVKKLYVGGTNDANLNVLHAVGTSGYIADGQLTAEGVRAVSEYVTMPVTAGLYNAAYDAQNAFTGAVNDRALEKGQSYGVWANAYYAQNEAKTLYGETGYKSDIYGGVMGADASFSDGARLGAAFTFGKADVDSKNTLNPVKTDTDFWGLSLYASQDLSDMKLAADISYVSLGNDISGSIAGAKMDESVDSTVWTVGLKGEAAVYETNSFSVVPHFGFRYASIDVDDYRGIDAQKLDVFEFPVGVTFKGNFETAGLTVSPFFDMTAAIQLGDKEVDTVLDEADVLGNVYTAKLGVEASKGNFTFGAHYSYH